MRTRHNGPKTDQSRPQQTKKTTRKLNGQRRRTIEDDEENVPSDREDDGKTKGWRQTVNCAEIAGDRQRQPVYIDKDNLCMMLYCTVGCYT